MPYKKGHKKMGGRPKGGRNKVSAEIREMIEPWINGEMSNGNYMEAAERVRKDNPAMYMKLVHEAMTFVVPKKKDITSDGEQIGNITITEITKK